ncbi:pirin family protein [Marinibactrum halimedae]|uniref:Pirin family protein n=1 Tax=Marinibactrum halimedae TaxID=1444977 RepID=A0AA37T433_9GAMM|nr:pirin family protein [Marinibactrum halimedae]MCD9459120.1 pirin family protein [Marinibactrum halimedae]GLS24722.1 hypothetical protein GCM10007877_04360 [Marinibactrum halimedae]
MDYIRFADDRGSAHFGWLDSKHTFSFGSYYDSKHMGIGSLRVINDDTVAPAAGFDTHGHKNMEIISYVTEGTIEHKDSMGNHFVVPAGEVQRMSAGTGITHSEYNASTTESLKFLQIWIQPKFQGIKPSYEQAVVAQKGKVTTLISPEGHDGSLTINQDAIMQRVVLKKGESVELFLAEKRSSYLHMVKGQVMVTSNQPNQHGITSIELSSGDGIGGEQSRTLSLTAINDIEALWFDLKN